MKKILFFISIAITVTFSSCTTSLTTANSVQPGVKVQTAAEADLSVKEERVSATLKGRLNKRYTLDELKEKTEVTVTGTIENFTLATTKNPNMVNMSNCFITEK